MSSNEHIEFGHDGLLRFITAGSVDDGKSTLIGRLLHDSQALLEDQLAAVARSARRRGIEGLDLSLVTDGLQAEQEQGITIDVAYRPFATPQRRFIIADAPGHEQYTRNLVTGASTADLALLLVDAAKGWLAQSRRHACLVSLMGIPQVLIAVNKMDLVGYSRAAFEAIVGEFEGFAAGLGLRNLIFIPVSALRGDMVVERGESLSWYQGPTLLEALEAAEVRRDTSAALRFPVQWVTRPGAIGRADERGFMGRIESGTVAVGEEVVALPSGRSSHVAEIATYDGALARAFALQCITLRVEDPIDVSRGDLIVKPESLPHITRELDATVCWLVNEPLSLRREYLLKHATRTIKARLSKPAYRVDINTLEHDTTATTLGLNDIGRVRIQLQQLLAWDRYSENRATGSFILVDPITHDTVAAGMIA